MRVREDSERLRKATVHRWRDEEVKFNTCVLISILSQRCCPSSLVLGQRMVKVKEVKHN